MPDPRLGERACAFVVVHRREAFDLRRGARFLDAHKVAKQYWPERVETVAALPRNAVGKVQKFVLRERRISATDRRGGRRDPGRVVTVVRRAFGRVKVEVVRHVGPGRGVTRRRSSASAAVPRAALDGPA